MSWQECGECRMCAASSWHRKKCRDKHDEEMERQMMNEIADRHYRQFEDEEYLKEMERRGII